MAVEEKSSTGYPLVEDSEKVGVWGLKNLILGWQLAVSAGIKPESVLGQDFKKSRSSGVCW